MEVDLDTRESAQVAAVATTRASRLCDFQQELVGMRGDETAYYYVLCTRLLSIRPVSWTTYQQSYTAKNLVSNLKMISSEMSKI